jgi:hypothetical protein
MYKRSFLRTYLGRFTHLHQLNMTRPPMTRPLWLEGTQRIYLSRFSLVDCYEDLDNVNKLVCSHFPIQFIIISLWYKYHSIKSNSFLDLFLAHTSFQYGKNDRGKVLPTSITMDLESEFLFLQHPFGLNYVLEESLFWSSFLIFEIKFELINGPKSS